jgi:hypothetical protein
MLVPGKPIKLTKWIHGRMCVVRVQVDAIIPDADPSQTYLEPAVVKWLDELQGLADTGSVDVLANVGDVYVRRSA